MTSDRYRLGRECVDRLVAMLPSEGSVFPLDERVEWLRAMAATLTLMYGIEDGRIDIFRDGDDIKIEVRRKMAA